jgi:hypothetical protein
MTRVREPRIPETLGLKSTSIRPSNESTRPPSVGWADRYEGLQITAGSESGDRAPFSDLSRTQ